MSQDKPRRLGRGLEALIGSASPARAEGAPPVPADQNELRRLPLARIRPNPFQPRREFSEEDLAELRASLQASGLLQPVVVRAVGDAYELVSGERRFRAATQLGWRDIPALVRQADDRMMLTLALIENLQRADLNVMEEARGYQRLADEFALTHQQISEAVGKERSTVSNLLRLLALPADVQRLLEESQLTMGHARALLALTNAKEVARLAAIVIAEGLSVRETERRVRAANARPEPATPDKKPAQRAGSPSATNDVVSRRIQDMLRHRLQTDVELHMDTNGKGTIRIAFYSRDDLSRLVELVNGEPEIGD